MENPLKNIELKVWPDFLLAVSAVCLVMAVGSLLAGVPIALPLSPLFGGIFVFAIAAKISHYRFRDRSIKGNSNAWFSGWRHSVLADGLAVGGIGLIGWSIWLFL